MIYRTYGKTGETVSAIGFGGMRFPEPQNVEQNAELLLYAHEQGITYFDTAPYYCDDKSEESVGAAIRQLKPGTYTVSTKCGEADGEKLRASLEQSLDRLGLDCIPFFNIWCIKSPEDWEARKKGGAVDALLKARDEGLVKHVACSTHMGHNQAASVFDEGIFDAVTLGYNAVNFPFREQVIADAARNHMGVTTMNPLNGGLIPQHAERFDFIRSKNDPDVVQAGLRFILSNPAVHIALVGLSSKKEIDQAVAATHDFTAHPPAHIEQIKKEITEQFNDLCTGCGYCLPCPQGISIPRMMDSYNMRILNGPEPKEMMNRVKFHWGIDPTSAETCTQCGACEKKCTQHLPIIERLNEIVVANRELEAKS